MFARFSLVSCILPIQAQQYTHTSHSCALEPDWETGQETCVLPDLNRTFPAQGRGLQSPQEGTKQTLSSPCGPLFLPLGAKIWHLSVCAVILSFVPSTPGQSICLSVLSSCPLNPRSEHLCLGFGLFCGKNHSKALTYAWPAWEHHSDT